MSTLHQLRMKVAAHSRTVRLAKEGSPFGNPERAGAVAEATSDCLGSQVTCESGSAFAHKVHRRWERAKYPARGTCGQPYFAPLKRLLGMTHSTEYGV
jgi:hypothetical protein